MHVVLFQKPNRGNIVPAQLIGVFFTNKQAEAAVATSMEEDNKQYPKWTARAEQTPSNYRIIKSKMNKVRRIKKIDLDF